MAVAVEPGRMRTLAIINPHSGDSDDLSVVASSVRHHPAMHDPDVRITGDRDDARILASAGVRRGFQRVFAVGGDGTLNEVVNGILECDADARSDVVVGLLPLGTGNDFARVIGMPRDLDDALDAVDGLVPRAVDVVLVRGARDRYFINASAGGFSGEVDEKVTRERKRSWGPLAYFRGALDLLPDPPGYRAELELDGERLEMDVLNVVVGNGRSVAGGIPVAPEALADDGLLDVVVLRQAPVKSLAGFVSRCLVGKHLDHELGEYRRAARVTVRAEPPMAFNVDGEVLCSTPLEYEVLPGELTVLAAPDAPGLVAGETG